MGIEAKIGNLKLLSNSSVDLIVVSNIFSIKIYIIDTINPINPNITISFLWFIFDGARGISA